MTEKKYLSNEQLNDAEHEINDIVVKGSEVEIDFKYKESIVVEYYYTSKGEIGLKSHLPNKVYKKVCTAIKKHNKLTKIVKKDKPKFSRSKSITTIKLGKK